MVTELLPAGKEILHPFWPEARFNVSGVFVHDPLLCQIIVLMERRLKCPPPIEALHGAPFTIWNAGRMGTARFQPPHLAELLHFANSRNIGYYPTFTSHLIEERDLADPVGNAILEGIAQRPDLNAVLVVSDRLSDYIARKYPALRQIASVVKVTFDRGQGRPDYYRQLGQRFFRHVVHPDDLWNMELLDQLDRDKAELLVNENCGLNCPMRTRHYDAYARLQRTYGTPQQAAVDQDIKEILAHCRCLRFDVDKSRYERSCNLSAREMKALYDMGFRHFKLQGRGNDPYTFSYDLTRFLFEPITMAPTVFKMVAKWLGGMVEVRK